MGVHFSNFFETILPSVLEGLHCRTPPCKWHYLDAAPTLTFFLLLSHSGGSDEKPRAEIKETEEFYFQ